MLTTRKRGATLAVATLAVLLSGAFSGCSVSKDEDPKKSDSAAQDPTPTQSDEPTETPSETPSPSASATAAPAGTPEAALIGANELPKVNDTSPWTEGKTFVPGQTSFGLCQQFDLLSIGAMTVVERRFIRSNTTTAGQQLAEFPDAQNTVRASKVLEAWHDACRDQVEARNLNVRPIQEVSVPNGKGWWYLASYNRFGHGHFHSFGVAYHRNRMTLLKMDHLGQDHNYAPGQDPMELAVKAASAKMG